MTLGPSLSPYEQARMRRTMYLRLSLMALLLAPALPACGESDLTVSEYASAVEVLVENMATRFVLIDNEWESQPPSVDGATRYWEERLAIRADFLSGVIDIVPPDQLAEMHAESIDLFRRITAADEALAARAAEYESLANHRQWLETPEGEASLAVLEDVYAFCRASQAEFDATGDGESFAVGSWLRPEEREAVRVAFGCPPATEP